MGQGTSIWIVPSSQQSREGQLGTALSSPGQRGREGGRQPQRSQQNHRPPGQRALFLGRLALALSVLLPGSKKAFLCLFWQEEFSKDNLMCSTSQQTAATGETAQPGKCICPLMPPNPCLTSHLHQKAAPHHWEASASWEVLAARTRN